MNSSHNAREFFAAALPCPPLVAQGGAGKREDWGLEGRTGKMEHGRFQPYQSLQISGSQDRPQFPLGFPYPLFHN